MKALYEDISGKKGTQAFFVYQLSLPLFEFKWHYHPEYELTYIIKGSGKRMVGDSYESFESGDLVLIGPLLPHTWVSDAQLVGPLSLIGIQFSQHFIDAFLEFKECSALKTLLTETGQGLHFKKPDKALRDTLLNLVKEEGVTKITGLLHILNKLTKMENTKLASPYFQPIKGKENEMRINTVCQYLQEKFNHNIELKTVAELIHLSESAFCKFFKRATGKTYSDYLNEIRIGHACTLLTESDHLISDIAARSGFESLTYFNRTFAKKKGMNPREFRRFG